MILFVFNFQMISVGCFCSNSKDAGLVCDLLWAYFDADVTGWADLDKAIELIYGPDVLDTFLRQNNLETDCRFH